MARDKFREEVLNVTLARLLERRGVASLPEQATRRGGKETRLPDVLVVFQGLRTILEGKVADFPNAEERVMEQARERVEEGLAHIGVAVLYPEELRDPSSSAALERAMERARLRIAVYSEATDTGFADSSVDELGDMLRRTFEQLVREDNIARAVAELEEGVRLFSQAIEGSPASVDRCAAVLGIGEGEDEEPAEDEDE